MAYYENGTVHHEQRPLVQLTEEPTVTNLGPVMQRTDIKSSMGPFHFYPEYGVQYPEVVTQALIRDRRPLSPLTSQLDGSLNSSEQQWLALWR